jgi:hypothetical protein
MSRRTKVLVSTRPEELERFDEDRLAVLNVPRSKRGDRRRGPSPSTTVPTSRPLTPEELANVAEPYRAGLVRSATDKPTTAAQLVDMDDDQGRPCAYDNFGGVSGGHFSILTSPAKTVIREQAGIRPRAGPGASPTTGPNSAVGSWARRKRTMLRTLNGNGLGQWPTRGRDQPIVARANEETPPVGGSASASSWRSPAPWSSRGRTPRESRSTGSGICSRRPGRHPQTGGRHPTAAAGPTGTA